MSELAELRSWITRLTAGYTQPRWFEDISVFATTSTTHPIGNVAKPTLALVAQGVKRSMLGDRVFEYHAGEFLVVTVDLPLTSQVVHAKPSEPFLAFGMPLDPATITQLVIEAALPGPAAPDGPALSVSKATPALLESVIRLLRLLDSPMDKRILSQAARREIHWRLLTGPQGSLVRQIGIADSRVSLVARAVEWIKTHFDQVIRIDDLAAEVGLSVSSLNRHFRSATAMSPLQYQKQLRLQQARINLIANPTDIAGAGHAVGYTSASQFSREYRRLFGAPPGEDARRLQNTNLIVD